MSKSKSMLTVLALLALTSFAAGCGDGGGSEQGTGTLKSKQKAFTAFYSQLVSLSKRSDTIMTRYNSEVLPAVSAGDSLGAYSAVKDMQDDQRAVWVEIDELEEPEALSKSHREQLKEAQEEAHLAAFLRMEAMEKVGDYLDSQEISDMGEAKENIELSDQTWLSALATATGVGSELKVNVKRQLKNA